MPSWKIPSNGYWTDAGQWDTGVPNGTGAIAEFTVGSVGSITRLILFSQNEVVTVGTLNITTDADDGWFFEGDTGVTNATLRFQGAGGPAFINVDTNGSVRDSTISNSRGLKVSLLSDIIVTTSNSDTIFAITANISGSGDIYKFGTGTLQLGGDNSAWSGDAYLFGGRTEILDSTGLHSAVIEMKNGAVLAATENLNLTNLIEINAHTATSTIAAATGRTLTLSGQLSVASGVSNAVRFGSAADNGVIILTGTSSFTGLGGITISGGTVRLGSDNVALNYLTHFADSGLLQIANAGTLDTAGRITEIKNLDMDGGTLLASSGALQVLIDDLTTGGNAQSGTIQGTASADQLTVNVLTNFDLGAAVFTNWTNGTDTIILLGSSVGNFLGGSSQNDVLVGNGGNDTLAGNGGVDTLIGGTGNDTYELTDALDTLTENANEGVDTVQILSGPSSFTLALNFENLTFQNNANNTGIGNNAVNVITTGGGNDTLDGRGGADTMVGKAGDDFYFVDNVGDIVTEAAAQGNDRVFAALSYALGAGQSVELLTTDFSAGTMAINLTGNELVNTIIGNDGANILDGKSGADTMVGRLGDDFYFVENVGDQVVEQTNEGSDRVFAGVSYALGAGVSVEVLSTDFNTGTGAINLTGNGLANIVIGNDGTNMLDGGAAADTLIGRLGDDMYFVDNTADAVVENGGEGSDRVFASTSWVLGAGASVELITTNDNAGGTAINLTGNELANTIFGNDGVNVLDGKGGTDILVGRSGGDSFAFTTALGAGNVDRIVDFQGGIDKIQLDDAIFNTVGGVGTLGAGAFVNGAAAADADDRIIYNQATGQIFFDADGNGAGAQILFATLDTKPALTAGDFTVI